MANAETAERQAPGTMRQSDAVEFRGVDLAFGERLVLDNIFLSVGEGEIFGIVGPSGSGKTTLVRLIVGLLRPRAGEVTVQGVSPESFGVRERRRIGYMPQTFSLYPTLTTMENARFVASLYGIGWLARRKRIREVLTFLELWDARNRLASQLSGGMQRRLALACAILHNPGLAIVDEPTAGLDPVLRMRIWDYLRDLREQGATIVMTTQYIEEAEHCDGVAILSEGKVSAVGAPADLRRQANLPELVEFDVTGGDMRGALEEIRRLEGVRTLEWDGSRQLLVYTDGIAQVLPSLQEILSNRACEFSVQSSRQPSFERVFMHYTGEA
jgi:ABC-2 type transport system ATP-binding protein